MAKKKTGANPKDKGILPTPTKPVKKSHWFRNTILGLAAAGVLFVGYNLNKNNCDRYKYQIEYPSLERACEIQSIPVISYLDGTSKEILENYDKYMELNNRLLNLQREKTKLEQSRGSLGLEHDYCKVQIKELNDKKQKQKAKKTGVSEKTPSKIPAPSKEAKGLFNNLKEKFNFRSPIYSGYTPEDSDKLSLDRRHYVEELGLTTKVDGEKLLISTSNSLHEYARNHNQGLNAIIVTEDGNTLEQKLADGNASVDLNGKKYIGVAVYTDENLVLASHTSGDLVKTLEGAQIAKTPAAKIPAKAVSANQAPVMIPNAILESKSGEAFSARVIASDDDKVTFVLLDQDMYKDYQVSLTPVAGSDLNNQEAYIKSAVPFDKQEMVSFNVCAADEEHPIANQFVDGQCLSYVIDLSDKILVPQEVIIEEDLFKSLDDGYDAESTTEQKTPQSEDGKTVPEPVSEQKAQETGAGDKLVYSIPMQPEGADGEKGVEPAPDTKELELVLEKDDFTLHPFWRWPYRLFDEGNERIPMDVEQSKYEPNDLRRVYLGGSHKGKYGIIVHTDSNVGNLNLTAFDIDSGASTANNLRVNNNGNAKIHRYDIPRGADLVVVEDPESKDRLAFKVDDRILTSYDLYKMGLPGLEGTFIPIQMNEGVATLRLEKGTYELRENPNFKYMHDDFVTRTLTVDDSTQDIAPGTFEFNVNKDDSEIKLRTVADSRREETTVIFKIESEDEKSKKADSQDLSKQQVSKKETSEKEEPLQESERKLNFSFAGGMKDLHAKYETPAWDLRYDGTEYFGRIEGQYNVTDNTAAGANVGYSQSDSEIKDFGDIRTSAYDLGVFTRGSYGDKKVHLTSHAGYDRLFGDTDMEILGTDVEQTSATDRVTLNGIVSHRNIGLDAYLNIDFNRLEQDDPDFTRYGRDYRFSIGPVVQTQKLMFEPFFARISHHDMESEKDFVGNSAGVLAKYKGDKFKAMISAEVPVSNDDLRANDFYAAASIPLYKDRLFLNPSAGFNQVMIDDGDNEITKQTTYALIEISTSDLNLRTPHVQKSLYTH